MVTQREKIDEFMSDILSYSLTGEQKQCNCCLRNNPKTNSHCWHCYKDFDQKNNAIEYVFDVILKGDWTMINRDRILQHKERLVTKK